MKKKIRKDVNMEDMEGISGGALGLGRIVKGIRNSFPPERVAELSAKPQSRVDTDISESIREFEAQKNASSGLNNRARR